MKNILCIFLLAATFAAQAQMPANDLLKHIPADADQVTDVNLGTITSKMDLQAVLNILGSKAGKDKIVSMIQQLMSSGLDLHQHVIIIKSNSKKADSIQYFTVIAHITDSAKFVAFLRAKNKEAGGEPLHFVHLQSKERVVATDKDAAAWNDHLTVLTMYTVPGSPNGPLVPPATARLRAARRVAAALHGFNDTKFVTDNHFVSAFSDDGDVHIWSRGAIWTTLLDKFTKKMPGMNQFGDISQFAGKADAAGQSISTLRFDNGRINYRTLKFASTSQLAATKRMLGQGLNSELLALVPPRPLLGVGSLHFDMAALEDTLKRNPAYSTIDSVLQGKGTSVTDIIHALKGDFLFLVCQPDKATADSTSKTKIPAPAMFLVASISDKAAFEKIASMIKLKSAITAGADTMTTDTAHKNPFPYYIVQNDLVVLGKRRQVLEFVNSTAAGDPVGKLLPEQVRANTLDVGIDIHGLVMALLGPMLSPGDSQDPKGKAIMDMVQEFQTLQISIGAVRDDAMETNVELKLADQNKNSLTILTNMISSLAGKAGGGQSQ
jgi:hypothetical protein